MTAGGEGEVVLLYFPVEYALCMAAKLFDITAKKAGTDHYEFM